MPASNQIRAELQIRADLQQAQRARTGRTLAAGAVCSATLAGYAAFIGLQPTTIGRIMMAGAGLLLIGAALVIVAWPRIHLSPGWIGAVGILCLGVPLLAARPGAAAAPIDAACWTRIVAIALGLLLAIRVLLRTHAPRFGGGPQMLTTAAAATAVVAVGLACPHEAAGHMLLHSLGAATVVVVFGRLVAPPGTRP